MHGCYNFHKAPLSLHKLHKNYKARSPFFSRHPQFFKCYRILGLLLLFIIKNLMVKNISKNLAIFFFLIYNKILPRKFQFIFSYKCENL
jgi:hypothetical protein